MNIVIHVLFCGPLHDMSHIPLTLASLLLLTISNYSQPHTFAHPKRRLGHRDQSLGSSIEKSDKFLASRRWPGFFEDFLEVGLESANFIG